MSNGMTHVEARIAQIQSNLAAIRQRFEGRSEAPAAVDTTSFEATLSSALAPQSPENLEDNPDLNNVIETQAQQNGLPSSLIKAVIQAESGFNPNAKSNAGAQGLMQLMPQTAGQMGVQSILDPAQNIAGGSKYLGDLLDRFHSVPKALAAYNAGPTAVQRYGGIPPYSETQNYVNRVLSYQQQYQNAAP